MLTKSWGLGIPTLLTIALFSTVSTRSTHASTEAAVSPEAKLSVDREAMARTSPDRPLTADAFDKLMKAESNLKGVLQRDINLDRSLAMNGNENALEGWQHRLDTVPAVTEAIKNAGMTTQEYVAAFVSIVRASAVVGLTKQGKDVPPSLERSVPAENVAFVKSHVAQVEAWWKGSPSGSVKPNTMEDLYVAPEETTQTAQKPPEKPAVKKTAKTSGKNGEKTSAEEPPKAP